MRREDDRSAGGCCAPAHVRDLDTIDYELRLVAALRRAARKYGGPLPSITAADALLDERRELTERTRSGDLPSRQRHRDARSTSLGERPNSRR